MKTFKELTEIYEELKYKLLIEEDTNVARLYKLSPRSRLGQKKVYAYRFKDKEQMLQFVNEQYNNLLKSEQNKLVRKQEEKLRKEKDFKEVKVGDIFLCSWGYEQTNVDFYKLISLKGKKGVFQEVGYEEVEQTSWCSANVKVNPDNLVGEPFTKMLNGDSFKKYSFATAFRMQNPDAKVYKSWGY